MKTNGKPGKASRPFVPGGAPSAKGKAATDSRPRPRRVSRPMYQVDHPDYSELEGLGESPSVDSPHQDTDGRRPGGIRRVKLHGFAAVASPLEGGLEAEEFGAREDESEGEGEGEPQRRSRAAFERAGEGDGELARPSAESEPDFHASSRSAAEWARLEEVRFSPALKIRTSPTVRLLPQAMPGGGTPEAGADVRSAPPAAAAAQGGPGVSQAGAELAQGPVADGSELQFGTVAFDFKERSRLDLILPLQQPFRDTGYSLACSLDVPFCHAVVRAKLGAEAVVTLIRTQEEGNSRGRLDWIAAGRRE
ncbi:WIAG-tail domain [Paenibacillus pasadenensis]|uniref:WIAG-tail domain n=1 Tax=Paenibacillus pasadenensis TaxID=217090 RepID=UPI000408761A|nr:WIAG-tail domain [Paenibacillus pasadenensis]